MRVLIALGGNAMTDPEGSATALAQQTSIGRAMENVADLVAAGHDVVITHGNGPQVGNLLVKNQLAAHVVPPVPLDWCGAQTQATIGYTVMNALEPALARRGASRPVATVVTRTLVAADDPCFLKPTKPVGRYLDREQAATMVEHGEFWEDRGERGWRRVVASPEPLDILDAGTAATLLDDGYIVVCAGGGGIPVVRSPNGTFEGVEAVIDKDLSAAMLAGRLGLDTLVIATDVTNAVLDFGTPDARPIGRVDVVTMEKHAEAGQFASGSMGPKVQAALRFARSGGTSIITALDQIGPAVAGEAGTIITNGRNSNA